MLLFGRFYSPDKQFAQPSLVGVTTVVRVVLAVGFGDTDGRARRQASGNNVALRWQRFRARPRRAHLICDGRPICLEHENVQRFNTELNISSISVESFVKTKHPRRILCASTYGTATGLNVDDPSWPPVHHLRGTRQTSTALRSLSSCRYRPVITAFMDEQRLPPPFAFRGSVCRSFSIRSQHSGTIPNGRPRRSFRFPIAPPGLGRHFSRFVGQTNLPSFPVYAAIDRRYAAWLRRMSDWRVHRFVARAESTSVSRRSSRALLLYFSSLPSWGWF